MNFSISNICNNLFDRFALLSGVDCGTHERRLLNNLLQYYNSLERPVYNESEAVQLRFGLTLQQIIDVVSRNCLILGVSMTIKQSFTM